MHITTVVAHAIVPAACGRRKEASPEELTAYVQQSDQTAHTAVVWRRFFFVHSLLPLALLPSLFHRGRGRRGGQKKRHQVHATTTVVYASLPAACSGKKEASGGANGVRTATGSNTARTAVVERLFPSLPFFLLFSARQTRFKEEKRKRVIKCATGGCCTHYRPNNVRPKQKGILRSQSRVPRSN